MNFGQVVAAVIVGTLAAALIVYLIWPACMLSVGGTCLARGQAPIVAFLREFQPPALPTSDSDYVPIKSEEFHNCSSRECKLDLCEISVRHGQFPNVTNCMRAFGE